MYGRTNFVQTSGESQDHLVISQYKYKPPRADDIWGKTQPGVIITQGIARNSPLDEFLGLVKMPMPNAIQDSNNVAWGEDTVNALEAAALNAVQPRLADILKSVELIITDLILRFWKCRKFSNGCTSTR